MHKTKYLVRNICNNSANLIHINKYTNKLTPSFHVSFLQQISTTSNPLKPTTTTIPVTVQPLNMPQTTSISSTAVIKREELSTADLCDVHIKSPSRLHVTSPGLFFDYGGVKAFHGQIETVKCFESNPIVRKTLEEPGKIHMSIA